MLETDLPNQTSNTRIYLKAINLEYLLQIPRADVFVDGPLSVMNKVYMKEYHTT